MIPSFRRAQVELSLRYFLLTTVTILFLAVGLVAPYRLRDLYLIDQQALRQAEWLASSPEAVDDPAELSHEFEEIGLIAREPLGVLMYDLEGRIVIEHGVLASQPVQVCRLSSAEADQAFELTIGSTGRPPGSRGSVAPEIARAGVGNVVGRYPERSVFTLQIPGRGDMRAVLVTPLSPEYSAALVAVDTAASDAKFHSFLLILASAGAVALLFTALLAPRFAASALQPAQDSYRRMQQSLADASHELRTPLTAILGEAEVTLRHPRDPDTYRQALQYCHTYADQMLHVVESILELSRADARIPIVDPEPVDLGLIVASETESTQRRFPAGPRIICEAPSGHMVLGDMNQLARVVRNMLENAENHTPASGEIRVSVGPGPDRNTVMLRVADNGRGIAPEHLPHLFDRFYQVDVAGNSGGSGSGLGLAIVQAIVDAHSGTVSVESMLGEGATFTVILPVARSARR